MEDKKLNALSDEALDAVTGGKGKVYCQKNEETGMFDVIDEMTGRCICSFNTLEDAEKKTDDMNHPKKRRPIL